MAAPAADVAELVELLTRGADKRKKKSMPRVLYEEHPRRRILAVPQALHARECASIIAWAEQAGFSRAYHAATKHIAFRDNGRLQVYSAELASALWPRIAPCFEDHRHSGGGGFIAVGLNANFRFYKYAQGQRFGPHVDESETDPVTGHTSLFTVLFYLNEDDLVGGETVFYGDSGRQKTSKKGGGGGGATGDVVLSVRPECGLAVVHGHGEDCLLHEGALVSRGTKYLLRTDVMCMYVT